MNIVTLGSGHVATQLSKALHSLGHEIQQVYSKTSANAQALAEVLSANYTSDLTTISRDADLYIIAVSDQAINSIVSQLPNNLPGIIVHCSGATSSAVLDKFSHYGVIYPAQSIRKDIEIHLDQIPFAVEASDQQTATVLMENMKRLSPSTFTCSSAQRLALHTAAVFANNFSNALFQISYDILQAHQLPFELLRPMILETAKKVQNHKPSSVQTGPALRGDSLTIEKHLQFLSENPQWLKIYQQLTEEISSQREK